MLKLLKGGLTVDDQTPEREIPFKLVLTVLTNRFQTSATPFIVKKRVEFYLC